MAAIRLPEIPDLPTLYAKRPPTADGLSEAEFGQLMSLLAASRAFRAERAQLFFAA